jgi:hypothetical protein
LQQNGFTGRIIQQRLNGAVLGLPAAFWPRLGPVHDRIALPRDAGRIDEDGQSLSTQDGGYTSALGNTGLFADFEGIYVKGKDDHHPRRELSHARNVRRGRPNTAFNQINVYTNEGRSEYKAFVSSLTGTLQGGHLITASFTIADKKNINDDFSPALTDYPSDPANIEADGRGRADERYRLWRRRVPPAHHFTVAPISSTGRAALEPAPRLRLQRDGRAATACQAWRSSRGRPTS